jgi:long-chain acyl-CoA synthetase
VAVLIYTSGTTGPPKGAMLSHRNVIWMGEAVTSSTTPCTTRTKCCPFFPCATFSSASFRCSPIITHAYTVNFVENLDTVMDNMKEISPTVGYAVPRIWEKYYSAVLIRMSDATWFKRLAFRARALAIGMASVPPACHGFQAGAPICSILFGLAYFAVFRKLKERWDSTGFAWPIPARRPFPRMCFASSSPSASI